MYVVLLNRYKDIICSKGPRLKGGLVRPVQHLKETHIIVPKRVNKII